MDTTTLPVPVDASFVASQDFENILRDIKDTTYATRILEIIWAFPFQTVRRACLEELQNPPPFKPIYPPSDDIAERVIEGMMTSKAIDDRKLAEALLVWCLDYIATDYERPVDFALTLLREVQSTLPEHYSKVHGIVYGAIKRKKSWYWAQSVPEFLEASLANDNWTLVERALELICLAEDTSFLPRVIELSRKAGEEAEKKEDFKTRNAEGRFASAKARGVLHESVRHLLICKSEQEKMTRDGFEKAVSSGIVLRAGSAGLGVKTELLHPDIFKSIPRNKHLLLDLFIGCTGGEKEVEAFNAVLSKLRLSVNVEGAELSHATPEPGGFPSGNTQHLIFQPVCSRHTKILFKPLVRKTIRMHIELLAWDEEADKKPLPGKGMWKPFAQITRYISRAD